MAKMSSASESKQNRTSQTRIKKPSTINSINIFIAKETSLLVCYCLKNYIM